jgi:hypothetical protein
VERDGKHELPMNSLDPKPVTFDFALNHAKAQHPIRFDLQSDRLRDSSRDGLHGRRAEQCREVEHHTVARHTTKLSQALSPIRGMHQQT